MLLNLVWGVKGIQRPGGKQALGGASDLYGNNVLLDPEFDLEDVDAQRFIFRACRDIASRLDLVQPEASKCTFNKLLSWVAQNVDAFETRYTNTGDVTFDESVEQLVANVRSAVSGNGAATTSGGSQKDSGDATFESFFPIPGPILSEVAVFFLKANDDYRDFLGLSDTGDGVIWIRNRFQTTLPLFQSGLTMKPTFDIWEDLIAELSSRAPPAAGACFQTSDSWIRMFTEVIAVNGTVFAVLSTGFIAFLSMYVFTGSVRVSVLSIMTVTLILVFIVACFQWLQWPIGIIEAIAISILIDMTVDYSLHGLYLL